MNKEIKFTDEIVIPVMLKHGIAREEAEKRLQLLSETGILQTGDPGELETQQMIDDFLSLNSEEGAKKILFDKTLTQCLEDSKFVKEYDRISNRNMSKIITLIRQGNPASNTQKELRKFSDFVNKTVFARLVNHIETKQP